MGPFLADRSAIPVRSTCFAAGLAVALAAALVPTAQDPAPPLPARAFGACKQPKAKPAPRLIKLGRVVIAPDLGADEAARYRTAIVQTAELGVAQHTRGERYLRYAPANSFPRKGHYLDTSLLELVTRTQRDVDHVEAAVVTCKVSVRSSLAENHDENQPLAAVTTGARVTTASNSGPHELAAAREACVSSAIDDGIAQVLR